MNVNVFSDHIAYTLEEQEVIFSIGSRILEKSNRNEILSGIIITIDGHQRILYPIEYETDLNDIIVQVDAYEACGILEQLIEFIDVINASDFLCKEAFDINIDRIYYNKLEKKLKCVVLPFNREYIIQGEDNWNEKFVRLMCDLLGCIYGKGAEQYIDYIRSEDHLWEEKMNFLRKVRRRQEKGNSNPKVVLHTNNNAVYIEMVDDEMILGTSDALKGRIKTSTSVSRNHCKVFKYMDRYAVQDLNSTNGTRINGFKLDEGKLYYLSHGDHLQLADVELLVEIDKG